jgi:type IV secretion system protein VirD4
MHTIPNEKTGNALHDLARRIHDRLRLDFRGYILLPILAILSVIDFLLWSASSNAAAIATLMSIPDYEGKTGNPFTVAGYQLSSFLWGILAFILLAIILMLVFSLVFYSYRMHKRLTSQGSSKWANAYEIKQADLEIHAWQLIQPHNRLVLGMFNDKTFGMVGLTQKQQESHILIVAPTGKGKTSGVIVPALLSETGNRDLFINDVKGELIGLTYSYLQSSGYNCLVLAPTRPDISARYNPLAHIQTMEDAERFASAWIENTDESSEPFWNNAAKLLLTATTLHLITAEKNPPLYRLVELLGIPLDQLQIVIEKSPNPIARDIGASFFANIGKNERLAGSVMTGMATRLFPLHNPDLREITSEDEFNLEQILTQPQPTALFLSIPFTDSERLKPLSACFIMQLITHLTRHRSRPRHFAFYLDELANAGKIPHFPQHISLVRSDRIAFIMAIQDFGQLAREYGADAQTITANSSTHIIYPGMGKEETEYYSERLGQSTTYTFTYKGSLTSVLEGPSFQETKRPLMTPDELRTMQLGNLIILHENVYPVIIKNYPYYMLTWMMARVKPALLKKRTQQQPLASNQLWTLPTPQPLPIAPPPTQLVVGKFQSPPTKPPASK